MNTKAIKRVLASTLAAVMSVSVMPMTALAATEVKPEPAQEGAENILVEYFPTTFIDYDQEKTNQATQEADKKYEWVNKQDAKSEDHDVLIDFTDLTSETGQYQATGYHVRAKEDGNYYPLVVSRTEGEDNNPFVYRIYYDKGAEYGEGRYVWIDTWGGNNPQENYPVDKPKYNADGSIDEFEPNDNMSVGNGKIVYCVDNSNNYRVALYKYEPVDGVQQGKGFYFTGSTGGNGRPTNTEDIPLFSAGWGSGKDDIENKPFTYDFDGDGKPEEDTNNSKQDQDFYIYSGLAAEKLSESTNAPFNDEEVNAAPGFFSTDENVGMDYRTVYTNVKVPYVYDPATGNYTLDADKNGVYFPGGVGKSGATMLIADAASGMYVNGDGNYVTGLVPFAVPGDFIPKDGTKGNAALISGQDTYAENNKGERTDSYKVKVSENKEENDKAKEALFAFGMVTEVKFQMTDDGMSPVNGDPIKFHFAGDDDVWVYIDGVLALDIGGVHDRIDGDIDFVTGEVKVSAPISRLGIVGDRVDFNTMNNQNVVEAYDDKDKTKYQKTYDDENKKNVYYINQGNIYEKLGTTLTGFAAQGEHTLTIYYMERGEGKNNCFIQFNLPQRDTVSVTKVINKSKDNDEISSNLTDEEQAMVDGYEFGFTLYNDDKAVANKTYYVYGKDNMLISSPSTDSKGHFTLKNGQTAKFLVDIDNDDGSSYYVVEDEAKGYLTPEYTYGTNIGYSGDESKFKTGTIKNANGWTSMKVTAIGSDSAADEIKFVCENYLHKDLAKITLIPDTERIVIDYGLPITIPQEKLLEGDICIGGTIKFNGLAKVTETPATIAEGGPAVDQDGELIYESKVVEKVEGDFGTATYDSETGDITYTLNKQLTKIETLYYSVTATAKDVVGDSETEKSVTSTGKILIMPATSMYYEENFGTKEKDNENKCIKYGLVTYSDQTTEWKSEGKAKGGNQETGFVGTKDDSTYGSDVVYMNHTGDSYGTSMRATTTNAAAKFEYDFTGTGTAIYGRVSPTTGYIRVKITDNDKDDNVVDWQYIDTVEINSVGNAEELHNIPIYINTDLAQDGADAGDEDESPETGEVSELAEVTPSEVGNYHVEVLVYKKGTPTNREGGSGADFYLDGIRIYNPILNNDTVNTAYADDGESNTVVLNIRDKIQADVEEGEVDKGSVFTLTDKYGDAITDADYKNGNADYKNYVNYGPNNEFYLYAADDENDESRVYTISFKLIGWDSQLYKLYLGMKAPADKASVKVGNQTIYLNNSTECYYDISNYITFSTEERIANEATVTISGNVGLASLTNLKVTGTEAFDLMPAPDVDAGGEDEDENTPETEPETEPESGKARVLYIAPATFSLSDNSGATIPDEDETVFEETEFNDTESDPDENIPEENETDGETTEDTDEVEIDPIPGGGIEGEVDTDKDKIEIEIVPSDKVEIEIIPDDEDAADAEFTPDLFRTDCSYKSRLKTATISVMTSTDASYITIDGKKISGTKIGNVRIYLDIRTRVKSGTSFEIIAYDKDGNASEVYTVTAD